MTMPASFIEYLWGIETANLDSTSIAKAGFIEYLWGIETGYRFRRGRRTRRVYRIPMRDWNRSPRQIPDTDILFIEYLWGIETSLNTSADRVLRQFIEYLWGIETRIIPCLAEINWKFIEYLWGIETHLSSGQVDFWSLVYRIPMRDWNSVSHRERVS